MVHSPSEWRCQMAEFSPAEEEIVLAHFIVSDDVDRSRRFYTEVLGGTVAFSGEVTYVALANSYIIINVGGGPTDDKPTVTLETPRDPDRVTQSGAGCLDLRDAVLEATLRLTTRHEKVALAELENPRSAASMRTKQ